MSQNFSPYQSPSVQIPDPSSIPTAHSDDILLQKEELEGLSLGAKIATTVIIFGILFGFQDTSTMIFGAVIGTALIVFVAIPMQIYKRIRGTRTITLFRDSIVIQRRGDRKLHRLENVISICRWKNSRSNAKAFDAFYFFKLKLNNRESILFETNEALPFLVESVSAQISKDLADRLSRHRTVKWGPGVVIQKGGLKMLVPGLVAQNRLVTWDELGAIKFVDDQAHVFIYGKKKVVAKISSAFDNFFPILELVREMVRVNTAPEQESCTVEVFA